MKNIFAYTEPTPQGGYPGYICVNEVSTETGSVFEINVRASGSQTPQQFKVSTDVIKAMMTCLASSLIVDDTQSPTDTRVELVYNLVIERFLKWKLPEDFSPDCYVSFDKEAAKEHSWPTGTNLFTAQQVKDMFKELLLLRPLKSD